MQYHRLKCDWEPFQKIEEGKKTSEFRNNDRSFVLHDLIELTSVVPENFRYQFGTEGRSLLCRITDVQPGGVYGIPDGYVVLSIELISIVNTNHYMNLLDESR